MKKTGKGFGVGKGLIVLGLAGVIVGVLSHKENKSKNMITVDRQEDEDDEEEDLDITFQDEEE